MHTVAARVYNLDPLRDCDVLQSWSAHSLRVGACVILHAMGYTAAQIQWLLRWRSMAFLIYLRNLAVLADKHNITFNEAMAMPHFL
jgi:hypothetical protein